MTRNYHKALAVFIDILGSRDRVDFQEAYTVNTIFHDSLEKYITEEKYKTKLIDKRIFQSHVYAFSDCSYVIYDYNPKIPDNLKNQHNMQKQALYSLIFTLMKMLKGGFIFRGGMTWGDVYYEEDRALFFGSAINRAYLLESKEAKMPRILIDEETAQEYLREEENFLNAAPSPLHRRIAQETNGEIILTDTDGRYYLNYFVPIRQNLYDTSILDTARRNLQQQIRHYKALLDSETDESQRNIYSSIIAKHEWMIDYVQNSYPDENIPAGIIAKVSR